LSAKTGQHLSDFVAAQFVKPDRNCEPAADEIFQRPGQTTGDVELDITISSDHQQG
jgi:hypothetical protein